MAVETIEMARKKTVLVVVAHADDMEFLAGGTVARFVREKGYDVYEYILTDNGMGSYRLPREELVRVSAVEAVEAGNVLGLKEVRLEGYRDAYLNEEHPNVVRGKIAAMMREVRADIVMSWDPFAPYEDHPDHRVVAMAAYEAAAFSGNPLFHPEQPHGPCKVTEAYWFAKASMNATTYVDITETIDLKIEALLKHDCQMQLTVDMLAQEAETLGVDAPGLAEVAGGDYAAVIDAGIRDYCGRVGQQAGMTYAELFRYEPLVMLDRFLGIDVATKDF